MQFIDLKAQYVALKEPIDAGIQRVLDHGQFIMGPEVQEHRREALRDSFQRHRGVADFADGPEHRTR